MLQNEALILLKMGKNIFLTGEAGSGKTYLLNQYIHYLKSHAITVAVTATTGIAATHLQGETIHSWSGIGVRDQLTAKDLEKMLSDKRIKRKYKNTKAVIVDEISMLHKHQLDMVDILARHMLGNDTAFGGLQMVLCGDFFQLPPVSTRSILEEKWFAFESSAWNTGNFHVCYLHEQHRQSNDPLLAVLNDIRSGTVGEHTKIPLRTRYKKEPQGNIKATKLYSRNINVDAINERELLGIQSKEKLFTMEAKGFNTFVERLKKNCLALEQLRLKIGAEVMFIKNDPAGKYVNGTRSIVVGFDKVEGWPVVKTYAGETITALPVDWKYEEDGAIRASITQVPLRLAWAITIHKSQGMTLDTAEIDLGDAFEPGMGYVALSRVRSLNGLKLMNLNEMALKVHPKILQQDKIFRENSATSVADLAKLSKDEIMQSHIDTLIERFESSATRVLKKEKVSAKKGKTIPTHTQTLQLLKENLSLEVIAAQRQITIGTVLDHIEKLCHLKMIDSTDMLHLKNMLPKNDFDTIFSELTKSEDGRLKPVYDKFAGKYSYNNIQLVRLFLDKM